MKNFSTDIKLLTLLESLWSDRLTKDDKEKKEAELNTILRDIDRINIRKDFSNDLKKLMNFLIKYDNEGFELDDDDVQWDTAINLNLFDLEYAYNYYKLIPPFVDQSVEIPEKVKALYAESRYCFVFRQYSASIVLSRAIIEIALKIKLKVTEEKDWKVSELLKKAQELKYIDGNIAWNIIGKANNILHRSRNATQKESLYVINQTKQFLEDLFD